MDRILLAIALLGACAQARVPARVAVSEANERRDEARPSPAPRPSRKCRDGDPLACRRLRASLRRAEELRFSAAERRCRTGEADACAHLAFAYRRGLGTARDDDRARRWAIQSCDRGSSAGCVELADSEWETGDRAGAVLRLMRLCRSSAHACHRLATYYRLRPETSPAPHCASALLSYACAHGVAFACRQPPTRDVPLPIECVSVEAPAPTPASP